MEKAHGEYEKMNEYTEMCAEMGVPRCEFMQPKIAFIYYDFSSFVKQDYEILSSHFDVETVGYRRPRDLLKIVRAIWGADISFSWFASGHAFAAVLLSKIMRKKSIVVAGGYDVAYMPGAGYGLYCGSWLKRAMTNFVLKQADKILAISKFSASEIRHKQPNANIKIIYCSVDVNQFVPSGNKENLVITVGKNTPRKRLDVFIDAAKLLPYIKFVIIGADMQCDLPPNVTSIGRVPDIMSYYQSAKVYCQLSFHEGFGVALAEAMACECVPVVTRCGAMPEVVGETGVYVPYGDARATAKGIQQAMGMSGEKARTRIIENFQLRRRERELIDLFVL